MNKKEAIEKIKAIFLSETKEVEETVVEDITFIEVKLEDGRIFRADDIKIDSPIVEITEDGEMPIEDGEYQVMDGDILVITGGIITDILVKEEETPVEDATDLPIEEGMESTEELSVEEETVEEDFTSIIEDFTKAFNSLKEEIESLKGANLELSNKVEEFSKSPSVEETNTKLEFKSNNKKNSVLRSMLK